MKSWFSKTSRIWTFFQRKAFRCLCCWGFLSAVFVELKKSQPTTPNQPANNKNKTTPPKPQWGYISLYLHINTQTLKFSSSSNAKEKDSNVLTTWNNQYNHIHQEIQDFQEHFLIFLTVLVKMCTVYWDFSQETASSSLYHKLREVREIQKKTEKKIKIRGFRNCSYWWEREWQRERPEA